MKNYRITVNGTAYDVAVEELGAGAAPAAVGGTACLYKLPQPQLRQPQQLQPQQALSRLQLQCQVRS